LLAVRAVVGSIWGSLTNHTYEKISVLIHYCHRSGRICHGLSREEGVVYGYNRYGHHHPRKDGHQEDVGDFQDQEQQLHGFGFAFCFAQKDGEEESSREDRRIAGRIR
jgi:hypothetical protein